LALARKLLGISRVRLDRLVADVMTVSEKLNNSERLRIGMLLGTTYSLENPVSEKEAILRIDLAMRFLEVEKTDIKKDKVMKIDVQNMILD
jgi:hypothetical protein